MLKNNSHHMGVSFPPFLKGGQGGFAWRCLQKGDLSGAIDAKSDSQAHEKDENEKCLRCSACKATIARQRDRISVNEQHQHVFTNPHGYIFQIGCFAVAQGCVFSDDESDFFSWFPGYAWRYALCGQCLTHLGWGFRSQDSQFVGLILDKLLIE